MKILFLVPYPLGYAPSQRFRFEQYFHLLEKNGHQIRTQTYLNSQNWHQFSQSGNFWGKLKALIGGLARRIMILFSLRHYDFIFVHREAAPAGPPALEYVICKLLKKKVIYDFDDAIWITDRNDESSWVQRIKWRRKVSLICKWSYKVSCGNHYLQEYGARFNSNVVYNPTTIDTVDLHNPERFPINKKNRATITLGWTGSHSTLKYLENIQGVLAKLEEEYPNLSVAVIADVKPAISLPRIQFIPWSLETEISSMAVFDIGLMPLPDDEWARGKCGFKILQYLALRIPAVASPVGVNKIMIENGRTGFLCQAEDEWYVSLKTLIENAELRSAFGSRGRVFVESHYSVISNAANFLSLFA